MTATACFPKSNPAFSDILNKLKAGKEVLKGIVESVTDWTGLDAKDWKDIWIAMGANPENADDETIQALLTAMGLERATTKADDSVVPTIDKVEGFASSNPQSRVSLQPVSYTHLTLPTTPYV